MRFAIWMTACMFVLAPLCIGSVIFFFGGLIGLPGWWKCAALLAPVVFYWTMIAGAALLEWTTEPKPRR